MTNAFVLGRIISIITTLGAKKGGLFFFFFRVPGVRRRIRVDLKDPVFFLVLAFSEKKQTLSNVTLEQNETMRSSVR